MLTQIASVVRRLSARLRAHAAVSALSDGATKEANPLTSNIGGNRLLRGLPEPELRALAPKLREVPLRQGDVLLHPDDVIRHVHFLLDGMASILVVTSDGQQIETAIVGREGLTGSEITLGTGRSFAQVSVQLEGAALRMDCDDFIRAYHDLETLNARVNAFRAFLMVQTQQSAACHALHDVQSRLCRWMLQAQDVSGGEDINLTQDFLSHMLGVQRTSVSVCAHALQKAGLIRYSRGQITILNRGGLEDCACECYRAIRESLDRHLPDIERPFRID